MSRKILVKAREVKVGHQKIEFQHNKKGPYHSAISDVFTNTKKTGDLKISHLMNRNHPKTGKPFSADELLGEKSKHGIRFVGGPNSAVSEQYPHHGLGGADEGLPSVHSSSEKPPPDSDSAQAPDSGQRSLEEFGLQAKMQKSHELGLAAAWGELMKAIAPRNLEFEARRPQLEARMLELLRQGYSEDQAAEMMAGEMDEPVEEYQGDRQTISPPMPARGPIRQRLEQGQM